MTGMQVTEFMYWLQGFFELSGATILTDTQIECIECHDRLVHEATNGRRGETMIKIGVMLQCIKSGMCDRLKGTEMVKGMVAVHFQHVIDPLAGDDDKQKHLNKIHGMIGGVDPVSAVYRC
jgi:hypothetical protein